MIIYVNLDQKLIMTSRYAQANNGATIPAGSQGELWVQFLEQGLPVTWPTGVTVGMKPPGAYANPATSMIWEITSFTLNAKSFYVGSLNTNTTEANVLLGNGTSPIANVTNCLLEVTWITQGNTTPDRASVLLSQLDNYVITGLEGLPVCGTSFLTSDPNVYGAVWLNGLQLMLSSAGGPYTEGNPNIKGAIFLNGIALCISQG